MSKKRPLTPKKADDFAALLADVKGRIQSAQSRAVLAVNAELVRLYWDIGCMIDARQEREGWGAAVIPRLAQELKNELPELKGFSERNIDRMIQFYREYPVAAISPLPVAKLVPPSKVSMPVAHLAPAPISPPSAAELQSSPISPEPLAKLAPAPIVQPLVAQLGEATFWATSWAHHVILMQKVKDLVTRRWYMEQTLANGWSSNFLALQIDAQAHARHGKAASNFAAVLPPVQSEAAQQLLKDPYIFDFLTLSEPFHERELETELVRHVQQFLLELGQGFAFVGRQYRFDVGDEDFSIDLLFYHLRLRAFVVIDLKKGKFKPEFAGKLNFYCNVVNDRLKHATDAPSIGLILCQSKGGLLAEYSFAGIDKPIGIATYELTRTLPKSVQSALPTVEEIEAELQRLEEAPKAKRKSARKKGGVR
jgi:predicted nuclease of restriction endonuclease-like (RecB) superfamily